MTYRKAYIEELSESIKRMNEIIKITKFNLRLAEEEMQRVINSELEVDEGQ